MTVPITFLPEAAADLEGAFRWYERQRPGLGRDFLESLDRVFRQVSERPLSFPLVSRRTWKAVVRRFPYLVFYAVEESGEVLVTGVLHAHRDPELRRDRIRERAAICSGRIAQTTT